MTHEPAKIPSRAIRSLFACLYAPHQVTRPGALVEAARECSSRVEMHGDRLVLIDASGLERLFGNAQAIGLELGRAAVRRGLAVRVAVAATRTSAWLMACAQPGLTVIPPGAEAAAVAPLPIGILRTLVTSEPSGRRGRHVRAARAGGRHYRLAPPPARDEPTGAGLTETLGPAFALSLSKDGRRAQNSVTKRRPNGRGRSTVDEGRSAFNVVDLDPLLATFSRWGLRTLGDLAALPAVALSARLGSAGPALWRIARGDDPRPLVPDDEPVRFEASCDLEWPVDGLEPLSFVLARVLEPLCADLERADRGAVALSLRMWLVTRETYTRTLQLPAPMRDARVLRTLLLLDLESHPPPAGIDRVVVEAEPAPGRIVQYSLIEHPRPSPEQLSTLMARLGALMGEGRCGSPSLVDSHDPRAFAVTEFGADRGGRADRGRREPGYGIDQAPVPLLPGVLRRFRVPVMATVATAAERPVRVTSGHRGLRGGRVEEHAGPWRTSGQWWNRSAWDRDEWDVRLADGVIYRLARDRVKDQWVIEGIVD